MILQRLAEHYDRIVAEGKDVPKSGFSDQLASFCIVLKPDGQLVHFEDLRQPSKKALVPKILKLPGQTKSPGIGFNPCFLWDRIGYLLGVSYDADPKKQDRMLKAFEAFKEKHLANRNRINDSRFGAVCNFLESWHPDDHSDHEPQLREMSRDCGVFRIVGENHYLHDLIPQPGDWNSPRIRTKKDVLNGSVRVCLVTGEPMQTARLHKPEIKGLFDADPKGMPLVSFNVPASSSYGNEQGFNAPVSEGVVFRYTNALNFLIRQRRVRLGDATVVYWADHATPVEGVLDLFFNGPPSDTSVVQEDLQRVEQAKLLISQLRSGTQNACIQPDDVPTRFFILGLSPNASRISVRLWIEADASEILRRLSQHVCDFALAGNRDDLPPPLWRIALATGRAEFDQKAHFKSYNGDSVSPKLAGDLLRSVLTGTAYPQYLLATMVRRIYSDGHISFERVSAIKGCLVRNTRHTFNPLEIPVELDVTKPDVAYQCGRIFAILEAVQKLSVKQNSNAELKSTIKDHYFSSASSTPALVFPRLCRLSQHHLAKINPPQLRNYFERELSQAISNKGFTFPRQLASHEQASFIVGYYQQRNFRKDDQTTDQTGENA